MIASTLRRGILTSLVIGSLGMAAYVPMSVHAQDQNSTAAVNVDTEGVGLHGYDPVAYFTVKKPTLGKAMYTHSFEGATYRFASKENLDKFKANPAMYAPQFGGFCAMGVALEKKLDGDPQAWRVVDNKLYLNVNKDIQKKWLEDVPGNIVKASKTWPEIKNKAPKDL
ncbi:YHS domain-containing (seleno)protein [Undibacterium cyanobacteriorum]|uniref:YHS domain-containing (Seleno)protein n=1 Tax=Undibacterium cyanobacteriorum TaxID=3073561 RepID=A0ABY9RI44_9BURK|nr:YHS domain-containing (seleno)protein [Undibacterium sp. 20NA77.5]WMW80870.1 YHS domain-containing (seleno)protein [Undibacterium sp. 20NA77.5]